MSLSAETLTVAEGGTSSYTIVLDSEPAGEVTVTVQVPEGAEVSVDDTELTFTPENWREPQEVTVTAAADEDAVVDEAVTLTHTVSGGDYDGLSITDVEISVTESDRQGVSLSAETLTVAEGGTSSYTIVLDSEPAGEVTVTVQVPEGAEVSVDDTELTFTPENWREPQEVTVTAAADEDAVVDEAVTLTHVVSGGDYDGLSVSSVEVSVVESDTPLLSIAGGSAGEGDGAMDFAVELSLTSGFEVSVRYATSEGTATEGADYEGTTGTLTFPAGTTEQSFQVPILDDEVDEAEESFRVVLSEASNAAIGGTGQAAGVIADDDLPVVEIAADQASVPEGTTAAFTLTRAGDLSAALRVPVQVEQEGVFLAGDAPSEAAFAAGEQTADLALATTDDQVDEADGSLSVRIAEGTTYRIGGAAAATVAVTDDDERGVTVAPAALTVDEGQSGTYAVVLTSEPTAAVTVTVEVPDESDVSVDAKELTFTVESWSEARTVTVTAAQDDDAVADEAVTLSHAVSGGDYDGVSASDVEVSITEDDTRSVTVSVEALTLAEGASGSYTIVLKTEPAGAVTVEVEAPEGSDVSVSPTSLTFASSNWGEAQTVTVTAAADADAVADTPVTVTHAVSGGDYDGVSATSVAVSITEDDTPAVSVSTAALTVAEGDAARYTVVLETEPGGQVTVAVEVPEGTDLSVSPPSLTFTAADWRQPKEVTVTAAEDDDAVADSTVMVTHTVGGGDYDGVSATSVAVSITEDDTPAVSVSTAALTVAEGDAARYTVVLETEPGGQVTVAVEVPEGTDLSVSPPSLTFTAADWRQPKEVTVTAAEDDDAVADSTVMVTHTVGGGDYDGVSASGVAVSITEDDTPGVKVSADSLTVAEGGSRSYTVVLETEPADAVTVAVMVPAGAEVSASPLELTFTAADWRQAQGVTVSAAQDDDAVTDPPARLGHSVSGGDYGGVSAAGVVVSVTEDDTPGVAVSVEALTVAEGGSSGYTVALETEPADTVTVAVQVPAGAEVSASPRALTFTAVDWRQAQRVAVTAAEDEDAVVDAPVTLTHAVSGGDYDGLSADGVKVSVTEDDRPALTIADATAPEEADSISFAVTLNVPSSLEVRVNWGTAGGTATEGADYEGRNGTLRFDALQTVRTVTVPLLDDALDEAPERFTVTLSNPSNAIVADGAATGTITDDDAAPALTIADATAPEGDGTISFTVSLGAVSSLEVSVDWKTSDGTAAAGKDYTASSGTLTIPPGELEQAIAVTLFNDALDEDDETLSVSLSNAVNVTVADGTAEGTIVDDDVSLEKAWLARFGRTTASQVMDAISDRLRNRTRRSGYFTLDGRQVSLGGRGAADGMPGADMSMTDRGFQGRGLSVSDAGSPSHGLRRTSLADLLSRSSFLISSGGDADSTGGEGRWTAWGRGVTTNFKHDSRELWLKGGALTSVIGIDWQQGRMLAGLVMAHNLVSGEYDMPTAEESVRRDDLDNHLASMHPYVHYALSERLSAWGVLGYGRGLMGKSTGRASRGIGMRMGGVGVRGALGTPERLRSFDLAVRSDAFWVRMDAPETPDRPEVEATSSRVRLALEGAREFVLSSGRTLSPSLELGLRQDGGDAETGTGMEVGGALGYTDPDRGLSLKTTARRLLAHRDKGYEEWGVAGSFTFDPGALDEGVSLRLGSSWGAASSGIDRLMTAQGPESPPGSPDAQPGRALNAEVGYGLAALGGVLTPYADMGLSGRGQRTCRLGWRLQVEQNLRVEVAGGRREHAAAGPAHEIRVRATFDW